MKTIGVIFNESLPGIEKHIIPLVQRLSRLRGVTVVMPTQQAKRIRKQPMGAPLGTVLKRAQLVIAIGGDGTTLWASRLCTPYEVPVLSVHIGGLGFLTSVDIREFPKALKKIEKGEFYLDERLMLEARVIRGGKTVAVLTSLNEVAVSKSDIARLVRLEARIDGERVNTYSVDGLIVATPTGSTAHNLSAGGPLLTPDLSAIVMTAICPHSFTHRPIVVSSRHPVDFTPVVLSIKLLKAPQGQKVLLTADGQEAVPLRDGDEVQVRESAKRARFARIKPYDFFATLRQKFNWGRETSVSR